MIRCLGPALELLHSALARGLPFYGHRFKSLPLENPPRRPTKSNKLILPVFELLTACNSF